MDLKGLTKIEKVLRVVFGHLAFDLGGVLRVDQNERQINPRIAVRWCRRDGGGCLVVDIETGVPGQQVPI